MQETRQASRSRVAGILGNRWTLAVLVVLFVVEARLLVVKRFGVQEPYMDSFSEVHDYKAAAKNDYSRVLENSAASHNEHHVFLTHWTNVALFVLNGRKWDLLLGACVNAVLAGLCAAALFAGVGRYFEGIPFLLFAGILLLSFGPPFSYENILWDFQSQHFYFILFSIMAICLLSASRAGTLAWWLGAVSAGLSCLSVGSGFYAALSVAFVCGFLLTRREYRDWQTIITLVVCLLIIAANIPAVLAVKTDPAYKARSVVHFLRAFLRHLAWPNITWSEAWSALLIQLPSAALAAAAIFGRRVLPKSSYAILGLAIWNTLVSMTLSYVRGSYTPHPRYYDYNCFNLVVNGAAMLEVYRQGLYPKIPREIRVGFGACWGVLILLGVSRLTESAWVSELPGRKFELRQEQAAIIRYYQDGDESGLNSAKLNGIFPFTDQYYRYTASLLRDPEVRRFLPNEMKPETINTRNAGPLSKLRAILLRRSDYLLCGIAVVILVSTFCFLRCLGIQLDRRRLLQWGGAIRP